MNTSKKLEEFAKTAEYEAQAKRIAMLKEMEKTVSMAVNEKVAAASNEASQKFLQDKAKVTDGNNRTRLKLSEETKQTLISKRQSLYNAVFQNVEMKLEAVVASSRYGEIMGRKLKNAVTYGREPQIIIMERDAALFQSLLEHLGVKAEIMITHENFIGGFQMVFRDNHILLDHRLSSGLLDEKQNFNYIKISV